MDLKKLQKGYSHRDVKRDIPSDEEIVVAIDALKGSPWQWIAGVMATYGLRDHEAFLCRLEWREIQGVKLLICLVPEEAKTGEREVLPMPTEWVERWNLGEMRKPKVTARINKDYGDRTSKAFKRGKIGFTPYGLRHAWAIRAALWLGLPTSVASRLMGHDPGVNLAIYQRHISGKQAEEVFVAALLKKGGDRS